MTKKGRVVAFLLAILLILTASVVYANDEIKKRERELKEINRKLKELDASIEDNKNLQSKTNQKIGAVNKDIRGLENEIDGLNTSIRDTEDRILVKTEELGEAELKISNKNELLNDRLRVMYKTGTIGYAEVLFGAESFTDLLSRVDMLQKILTHDQNLIIFLKDQRDIIATKKAELEDEKVRLEQLFREKVQKQDALKAALTQLVSYKEELKLDGVALAEMEDKAVEDADRLTEEIKNLKLSERQYVGGKMMWPCPGKYVITSPFGMRTHPITKRSTLHTGIDIAASKNTPIVAAQTGTVIYNNWMGTYGKLVILDHGGNYVTAYAHLNASKVKVGQVVKKGETIALSGNTGYSTGPHLHFEVRFKGEYQDPIKYVKGN